MKIGFENLAKIVIARQKKEKDTVFIIYGRPRSGKTTLGFKFLIPFLRLKRKQEDSMWKVGNTWKRLFRDHFADSAEDFLKKFKNLPYESFIYIDEGADVLNWHDQLTKEQTDLITLLQKTGEKRIFTIFITPSLSLLNKEILRRAHYMFIIPKEVSGNNNIAYILRNWDDPIRAEEDSFQLSVLKKTLQKSSRIPLEDAILKLETLKGAMKFRPLNKKLYNIYRNYVKLPLLLKSERRTSKKYVSYFKYQRIEHLYQTLLYNLYTKDDKSLAQLERLHIDKFGNNLATKETIKKYLNKISNQIMVDKEIVEGDLLSDDQENEEVEQPKTEDMSIDEIDEDEEE